MSRIPHHARPPTMRFAEQVRESFGRRAADYERHARLQQAMAWRLAHRCRALALPEGPCADLGAGSGLLSRALIQRNPDLRRRVPLQLDQCPELLARNPLSQPHAEEGVGGSLVWDLNSGLPASLKGAALLASSFALQWLDAPTRELTRWCHSLAPGGALVLAVPTAGSFPQWHQAAERSGIPCTALCLPEADQLIAAAETAGLAPQRCERLRFSRPGQGGLETLRHLRQLGASASRRAPLHPGQLRRLLQHWPAASPLTWEVLLLIARRPH
ncbi:MAG: SAM-dependent methyltransferase [Cyanobium sp.]